MKHYVLLAAAAALIIPSVAQAKDTHKSNKEHYTYKKVDMDSSRDGEGEYRIELKSEEDFRDGARRGGAQTFSLIDGQKIIIDGNTVYKVSANGSRFYAPNGSYAINNGRTVIVEDGQLDRIEDAADVVMFDTYRDGANHKRRM